MRRTILLLLAAQFALVVSLIGVVASRKVPLGVPGEWEWLRVHGLPAPGAFLLAALAIAGYCAFAGLGCRSLSEARRTRAREAGWLAALLAAALAIQVAIPCGAADEYDLTRWAYVNYFGASTGYYQVARKQAMADPRRFLSEYPVWIQGQDSLHIGTHPPGLIATQCLLLWVTERNPRLVDGLFRFMPPSTFGGFRQLERIERRPIPRADQGALYLSGLLTLLACAGTTIPLYLLARTTLAPPEAWAAAVLWPLAPAANLFQPDADTAYPVLSTAAVALAAWGSLQAARRNGSLAGLPACAISGAVLALGMSFTLAFLPVGLIVALAVALTPHLRRRRKLALVAAVGAGFLAVTAAGWWASGANPLVIWSFNLRNHARFYVEYPRTYAAWLAVNPIELAIALGVPSAVWCLVGWFGRRSVPGASWASLAVLIVLNLVGRNLGEVARLWLPFMPLLLPAAGAGMTRVGAGPIALAATAALVGLETLALQTMIQVVYPV